MTLRIPTLLSTVCVCIGTIPSAVHAADWYWDGNGATTGAGTTPTGTWGTSTFWSTSSGGTATTTAWTAGNRAVFAAGSDATTTYTVTISGTQSTAGLKFEEGTVTLSGGTQLTLTAAGIDVASTASISTVVGGSAGLSKTGTGALTLSGTNTYTGGTTLNDGTLIGGNASSFGSGTLTLSGGTLSNSGNAAASTWGNAIVVTASTTTTVNAAASANITLNGAITGTGTFANNTSVANSVQLKGNISGFQGTFSYNDVNNGNNVFFNGTGTALDGSQAKFLVTGATTSTRGLTIGTGSANSTFQMGELSGTGGLIGSTTGTGFITTLQVGALGTSTSFSGTIANGVNGGTATLAFTKVGSGSLTLSGTNTYTAGTNINAGTLVAGSSGALGTTGTISFGGGTLRHTASNTTDYSGRFSTAAGQSYKVDTNGQNVTWAANLNSSGGSLAKSGAGRLALAGTSTYSGATTVSAGTLLVNGSLGNTSAVSVSSGATLGGSGGSINNVATVSVDGTLAPGSSIGTLSTGTVVMNNGSTFGYEMDTTSLNGDLLNVAGDVTLTGTVALDLAELSPGMVSIGSKLTLISYSGSLTGIFSGYSNGSAFALGDNLWQINYADSTAGANGGGFSNFVTLTAVPEPRAALLGGLGVLALLRRRRQLFF